VQIKRVLPGTDTFRAVKRLYLSAFPENERLSFRRMTLLALLKPSVELLAYYEDDRFCGFSFTVVTKPYLYINFFAADPALRGKGYGHRMAELLQKRFPKTGICEVKIPTENTETYEEDRMRIHFWETVGFDFLDGKYTITNPHGVRYYVGTTDGSFRRDAYRAVFDHLSFGPGALLRTLKRQLQQ